jgi:hypothetical protein
MRISLSAGLWLLLFVPSAVAAQEPVAQAIEIGPSGAAYLEAVQFRGVGTDVVYYDPSGAVPRLETGQEPPPPVEPGADALAPGYTTSRILGIVLATALLIGVALLVLRGAGPFTLSLQGAAANPGRGRQAGGAAGMASAGTPADLRAILAMTDRRRAVVMLAQAALARTVAANGLLFQPSWTMRDALRRIPRAQAHLEALRGLVLAGEGVLFGNRDVTEAEFQAQVAAVRPLMGGTPP